MTTNNNRLFGQRISEFGYRVFCAQFNRLLTSYFCTDDCFSLYHFSICNRNDHPCCVISMDPSPTSNSFYLIDIDQIPTLETDIGSKKRPTDEQMVKIISFITKH